MSNAKVMSIFYIQSLGFILSASLNLAKQILCLKYAKLYAYFL